VSDRHVTIDILKVLKPEGEKNLIYATLLSKTLQMYSPMMNTLRDVQLKLVEISNASLFSNLLAGRPFGYQTPIQLLASNKVVITQSRRALVKDAKW
jgi:hypothetical protein